jgi:ubiquinone/menaquinone biosynthesis C-methylase UbiE
MNDGDEVGGAGTPKLPPVFWELHRGLLRQGPGDDAHTRRAFAAVRGLPARAQVVDVGCGPGMQTLELARLSRCRVTAVDNHAPFLRELQERAAQVGLSELVAPCAADMLRLPFAAESVDLFWSEGAIYIAGFEAGLRAWRPMLRANGSVAVTEATWLAADPPEPVARFWAESYPAMTHAEENEHRAEAAGYRVIDRFPLPPEAWWTHYYTPLEARLPELRRRHEGDPEALAALDAEVEEIELFRRYSDYYGYVFYVLQRTERG